MIVVMDVTQVSRQIVMLVQMDSSRKKSTAFQTVKKDSFLTLKLEHVRTAMRIVQDALELLHLNARSARLGLIK